MEDQMSDSSEKPKVPEDDRMDVIAEEMVASAFPSQKDECRNVLAVLVAAESSQREQVDKYKTWLAVLIFFLFGTTFHNITSPESIPSIFREFGLTRELLLSCREFFLVGASALLMWALFLESELKSLAALKTAMVKHTYSSLQQPLMKAIYDGTSQMLLASHRLGQYKTDKRSLWQWLRAGATFTIVFVVDLLFLLLAFFGLVIWVIYDIFRYPVISIWVSLICIGLTLLHVAIGFYWISKVIPRVQ